MMNRNHKTTSSVLIAALIAVPLSLLGGLSVFLMTQNVGHALTATFFGVVMGSGIYGLCALGGASNPAGASRK